MAKKNIIKNVTDRLYGNHEVYSPNNIFMFYCAKKRADWYLDRDLAEVIDETNDTLKIRLTFEPKGLGNQGDVFSQTPKKNICVKCGTDEELTKHHILPFAYKKHFPREYKESDCHDVAVMCDTCHHEYEHKALTLKRIFAYIYNVPLTMLIDGDKLKLHKLSKNILNGSRHNIPDYVINEFKIDLCELLDIGLDALTDDILKSNISSKKDKTYIQYHSKSLMDKVTDYQRFTEIWRKHFIDTVKPEHMPDGWSIDRPLLYPEGV